MKMYTIREAAEYLGCSVALLYQLCDERRLAHYRLGGKGKRGKIMINPRDLDDFMESQKVEARPFS